MFAGRELIAVLLSVGVDGVTGLSGMYTSALRVSFEVRGSTEMATPYLTHKQTDKD